MGIAQFFSLSVDMFAGNSANCILKNMDGRTKESLNLLPGSCYGVQLLIVLIGIKIWKSYKAKKAFDAAADKEEQDEANIITEQKEEEKHDDKIVIDDNNDNDNDDDDTKEDPLKWDHALSHTT